jgi:hypothetical protein
MLSAQLVDFVNSKDRVKSEGRLRSGYVLLTITRKDRHASLRKILQTTITKFSDRNSVLNWSGFRTGGKTENDTTRPVDVALIPDAAEPDNG